MSLLPIRSRGSLGSHVRPSRPDFKIYWFVRNGSGNYPTGFPGDLYYPGLTPSSQCGLHSKSVSATVIADMESVMWTGRAVTGGNGGISSTSLTITANGQRIEDGCYIRGTGITEGTYVVSYDSPGSATGTVVMSQANAVSDGTAITHLRRLGATGPVGGNGGVLSTSLTITSGGSSFISPGGISGYGIPHGVKWTSYTGGASGTLTVDTAVAVANGVELMPSLGADVFQTYFADYESGGETATDMQNILTWMRSALGYSVALGKRGFGSPPLGIYGENQCALNHGPYSPMTWTTDALSGYQTSNDAMVGALTGTGNAACDAAHPEVYCYNRLDQAVAQLKWQSDEWARLGVSSKLIPMINPRNPPGWIKSWTGTTCPGNYWRGILEYAIHDPNIYGIYIWHGDRPTSWDSSEEWLVETLDFISTYGITNGSPF